MSRDTLELSAPALRESPRGAAGTMRDRFYEIVPSLLDAEPDAALVLAVIGAGYLDQRDLLDDTHTVREVVLQGKADHEWAADARMLEVVEVLLADAVVRTLLD